MNTKTKSVSKVNTFFNKLKKYNSHNIIIYSNQENSLRDAIISDGRSNKISKIDGELITVKPNIKVANFPTPEVLNILKVQFLKMMILLLSGSGKMEE